MKTVLHSFAYGLDYLREQVADVPGAHMVEQPAGVVNDPLWVIGHLTVVCQNIAGAIGTPPWLPDGFTRRFETGSVPVADLYETKETALARLADAQGRITRAVEGLNEAQLSQPFPDPSLLDVFPTIRHALTQILVGHTAYHVGQVSIWRKAMGLRAISRSFE